MVAALVYLAFSKQPKTSNTNTLNVGLIGCGGRGSGAALQALQSDSGAVLVAMGDIFPDRIEHSLRELVAVYPDRVKVPNHKKFIGFDAYKKVIESDLDVVLLATPPVFRPEHFMHAINAGKHVFAEKPVAIDAPGVRSVLEWAMKAKGKKSLSSFRILLSLRQRKAGVFQSYTRRSNRRSNVSVFHKKCWSTMDKTAST